MNQIYSHIRSNPFLFAPLGFHGIASELIRSTVQDCLMTSTTEITVEIYDGNCLIITHSGPSIDFDSFYDENSDLPTCDYIHEKPIIPVSSLVVATALAKEAKITVNKGCQLRSAYFEDGEFISTTAVDRDRTSYGSLIYLWIDEDTLSPNLNRQAVLEICDTLTYLHGIKINLAFEDE